MLISAMFPTISSKSSFCPYVDCSWSCCSLQIFLNVKSCSVNNLLRQDYFELLIWDFISIEKSANNLCESCNYFKSRCSYTKSLHWVTRWSIKAKEKTRCIHS